MIKLIASDMDGTLLDDKGKIPSEFFDILPKLKEKGITFISASGRPYPTLHKNFEPVSDEISYISDNGAIVVTNGEIISVSEIHRDTVSEIVNFLKEFKNISIVLCGLKGAYYTSADTATIDEVSKYYLNKTLFENFDDVNDVIFKVSVCELFKASDSTYPILKEKFNSLLTVALSGNSWVDFTNKGIHKGNALEKIQKSLGISYDETMAFGDFFNDMELLKQAKYSYVMENAPLEMRQHGNFLAKSNTEKGVILELLKLI